MNATDLARNAYAGSQSPLRTARQAEYQVFSTVTARLSAAAQAPANFSAIVAALHDNRRLWTRLAVDVAGADNGLPQALRAQIFYLAEFTQAHSRRVLKGDAALQVLIDVNTAVMRGLGSQAANAPAPPTPVLQ